MGVGVAFLIVLAVTLIVVLVTKGNTALLPNFLPDIYESLTAMGSGYGT